MSLWYDNGGLVYGSGGLIDCDVCPCTGTGTTGTGTGTLIACSICKTGFATDEVELTVSGISNASCGSCASYNGTYVLSSTGSCSWGESWANLLGSDPCSLGNLTATVGGTYVTPFLWASLGTNSTYRRFITSPLDCESFNWSLSQWLVTSALCNWPASITVKSR